jgi:hypothetical protein
VRIFRLILEVAVLPMFDMGEALALGRLVAPQLIGHDDPRDVRKALQQLAEGLPDSRLVTPALDKNVEDISHLVHRAPEITLFATDGQTHLIQMPLVAWSGAPVPSLVGVGLPELPAPLAHGFIGEADPACGQQLLHIAIAEAEAEIQSHAIADDLCRETMAFVWADLRLWVHGASMPHATDARKAAR